MVPGRRILVVGGDDRRRAGAAAALRAAGLDGVIGCASVSVSGDDAEAPGLVVVLGSDAPDLCREAREVPQLAEVPVLAIVPAIPDDLAAAALAAGANDVAIELPPPALLAARGRGLLDAGASRQRSKRLERMQVAQLRIHERMSAGGDDPEVLRQSLLVAVDAMGFDRASLIAHIEGSDQAYVIAATDDPSLSKFTLSIAAHPEIRAVIRSAEPLLIDDAPAHPITAVVGESLIAKGVRAMAVFPVLWQGRPMGVVRFRGGRPGVGHVDEQRMAFGRIFAGQTAAQLHHGKVIDSLRDQTHRISRARYEAERRIRTIDSLKEHFEAAADGIVVLDEQGRILFVNRTAEAITGFARDGLLGSALTDLVPDSQRHPLSEVISSVLSGHNLEAFDLDLSTTSGDPICVSVTTSTVLSKNGAVILSFRDVTAQRSLEDELTKTKEFLEKLIDSTVDAIVAADIRGQVILFNQGAERIYGYSAEEIIGRSGVWVLYPEGVARQVMRMLRSTSYGGVGRLEQTRREIVNKSGELVPVNMTASIIYEDGREVATVGIFSDLRERIRIEQRLLQAQAKLQLTERQAVVAELAGTAAHELNQPLTSIIGYAELIQRQSPAEAAHLRAVGVILQEAERMAEIVKKIGRITKYETKEYVGSASIIDLDKSAAHSSGELVIPDEVLGEEPESEDARETGKRPAIEPDDRRKTTELPQIDPALGRRHERS